MGDDGRGVWRTQKARRSSADGSPVAWLLWPSGPLSSDCHSWGLRCTFQRQCHSSEPEPPTERRQARADLSWCHLSWQMERQRLETDPYLPPLICPFFCLPWLVHRSFWAFAFSLSIFLPLSAPSQRFSSSHPHFCFQSAIGLFREENEIKQKKKPFSSNSSALCPAVHIHLFGSLPPRRE